MKEIFFVYWLISKENYTETMLWVMNDVLLWDALTCQFCKKKFAKSIGNKIFRLLNIGKPLSKNILNIWILKSFFAIFLPCTNCFFLNYVFISWYFQFYCIESN